MEEYRKMWKRLMVMIHWLTRQNASNVHLEKETVIQKNVATYYMPSTSTNPQNFNAFAQELTQQMSQQFTEQMHQMFLSQNPNA
uniref:Uncharacterized protein n=1 Tax=Lactuca sativa TaxID=4236 RepID=A0A9R1VP69_LACSA|nr:hypothetical protein LSAT_V11C500280550 [Lactuca sativa]